MVGVGGLIDFGGAGCNNVRGVEVLVECIRLTGVYHKEHFVVATPAYQSVMVPKKNTENGDQHETGNSLPLLLPHLLKRIRQIPTPNLLTVLKL